MTKISLCLLEGGQNKDCETAEESVDPAVKPAYEKLCRVIYRTDCCHFLTSLSPQGKDGEEHSVSERGADSGAVEEQVGEREGEEQDAEKHCHLARDRAQPLEER